MESLRDHSRRRSVYTAGYADPVRGRSARRSRCPITDPTLVEQGKKIASAAQYGACHQPNFKGLNEFPRDSRQKVPYMVKQLKDFREGARVSDLMGPTVKNLTDEQIEALAQYLTSL